MKYENFELTPISGALGAEIRGIDVSGELSNSAMEEITSKSTWCSCSGTKT